MLHMNSLCLHLQPEGGALGSYSHVDHADLSCYAMKSYFLQGSIAQA